ncbi:hypothetical protein PM082_013777 [Marasmius tenuissimus]|nr:hypothetical protein PM082_013777 [Marasmius tenuissimus]
MRTLRAGRSAQILNHVLDSITPDGGILTPHAPLRPRIVLCSRGPKSVFSRSYSARQETELYSQLVHEMARAEPIMVVGQAYSLSRLSDEQGHHMLSESQHVSRRPPLSGVRPPATHGPWWGPGPAGHDGFSKKKPSTATDSTLWYVGVFIHIHASFASGIWGIFPFLAGVTVDSRAPTPWYDQAHRRTHEPPGLGILRRECSSLGTSLSTNQVEEGIWVRLSPGSSHRHLVLCTGDLSLQEKRREQYLVENILAIIRTGTDANAAGSITHRKGLTAKVKFWWSTLAVLGYFRSRWTLSKSRSEQNREKRSLLLWILEITATVLD